MYRGSRVLPERMSHAGAEEGAVDPVVLRLVHTGSEHLRVEAALAEVVVAVAAIKIGGPQSCQMLEWRRRSSVCDLLCMQQRKEAVVYRCR